MHPVRRWLAMLCTVLITTPVVAVDVLMSRNSLDRTGVNAEESILNPTNVNARSFGRLWTLFADGQIVAQPLYVSGLKVDSAPGQTLDAVLIATMHNTVYLYDADNERPGPQGRNVPLWARWLGQPRPGSGDVDHYRTSDPEWGILGTPVVDAAKTTAYVVAWHDDGGVANDHYRLHALRLKDGSDAMPPVEVQGPGLNKEKHKQRTGLLLLNGVIYIAFGGDENRGLVAAYDAATLQQRATWQVTPTGKDGGIWQAGAAPAADALGNVYLMTGNGTMNADQTGGANYGMSFVKLRLEGNALVVKDWFAPCDWAQLNGNDMDLGSSGPVLIAGGTMIAGSGKWPEIFLLKTDNLGHLAAPPGATNTKCKNTTAWQTVADQGMHHLHGSPVFWEGQRGAHLYLWRENDLLRAYPFANQKFVPQPIFGVDALPQGMPGGMLSLSSQGKNNGILWAITPLDGDANTQRGVRAVLRAIDAEDVTRTLWSSEQVSARDRPGLFAKYVPPTIAKGKVFVATYGDAEDLRRYDNTPPDRYPARYQVAVYGLLPPGPLQTIDQSTLDVQLVQATTTPMPLIDKTKCGTASAGSIDCTDELQRATNLPSVERLVVPSNFDFTSCRLVSVTVASPDDARQTALAIGFYVADATGGQYSADHGNRIQKVDLKVIGQGTFKDGAKATLHGFAAAANCAVGGGTSPDLLIKPYMEFEGPPNRSVYRNWEAVAENYRIGVAAPAVDRRGDVLR